VQLSTAKIDLSKVRSRAELLRALESKRDPGLASLVSLVRATPESWAPTEAALDLLGTADVPNRPALEIDAALRDAAPAGRGSINWAALHGEVSWTLPLGAELVERDGRRAFIDRRHDRIGIEGAPTLQLKIHPGGYTHPDLGTQAVHSSIEHALDAYSSKLKMDELLGRVLGGNRSSQAGADPRTPASVPSWSDPRSGWGARTSGPSPSDRRGAALPGPILRVIDEAIESADPLGRGYAHQRWAGWDPARLSELRSAAYRARSALEDPRVRFEPLPMSQAQALPPAEQGQLSYTVSLRFGSLKTVSRRERDSQRVHPSVGDPLWRRTEDDNDKYSRLLLPAESRDVWEKFLKARNISFYVVS
jgi:hypothetical protein